MIVNNFVLDQLRMFCENLEKQAMTPAGDVGRIEWVPCGYKMNNNTPPASGWSEFLPGTTHVEGKDAHFWFRMHFRTPDAQPGKSVYFRLHTGSEGLWDSLNPQGLVYLNGVMTQGLDKCHGLLRLNPGTEYTLHLYLYTCMENILTDAYPMLEWMDDRVMQLYYDVVVPYEACKCFPENSEQFARMTPVLAQAANMVPLRIPYSEEYYAGIERARAFLQSEFYGKLCGHSTSVVDAIGHTHIDVAWLWTLDQTREKAQRTFSTMLRLMEQYPEFKFMSSQVPLYQFVKESAPEIYAQIKQRVAEGRWEVEGAMWLEADCNLISGESMVRQFLYGKKFMKDEFGVDSRVLWLPDVFGYSAAMPQILKKCGVDYFVTSKISWNESNRIPVDSFLWQGIDGTEIPTDFITTQDADSTSWYSTYVGMMTPSQILGTWKNYQQKEYNDCTMTTYGFGDGGGGPTSKMIEYQRRMAAGIPGLPRTEPASAHDHLKKVWANMEESKEKMQRLPKWVGELYLEFHRGTYTSNAKNKRNNRKSEFLLQKAEALAINDRLHLGAEYPIAALDEAWESVLLHQFHDIIPGSSIKEVYDESDVAYAKILKNGRTLAENSLHHLAQHIAAPGKQIVYNPLGFDADGAVTVDGKTVEVAGVPAFGWKTLDAQPECGVTLSGSTAENAYYILTLDSAGRIARLWDKAAQREVFRAGCAGNELLAFEDYPRQYDAWEITNYYKQKKWALDSDAQIEPIADGSRAGFRVTRQYLNSTICQTIWLWTHSRRIDIENEIDWHERHQLLKASFPLDLHTLKATYEIQFGNIERPTTANTSWDAAKFEVCGHKWADMSEADYGMSLLNDCKYGYSAEENTLQLTLLKCATHPNPEADQGMHKFTYSLLPHSGDYRTAHTVREAYQLNQPLMQTTVPTDSDGTLPAEYSLLRCDCSHAVVDTVKQSEDGRDVMVRLYETADMRGTVTLTPGFGVKAAYLCNMLEEPEQELPVVDGKITLPLRNFEILTLRLVTE